MIIDWKSVENRLLKIKIRGMKNVAGNPAYHPIILFKMLILQIGYGLSDESVEDMVNENLSAATICWKIGSNENPWRWCFADLLWKMIPDHSTLSRFRKELTEKRGLRVFLRR